MPSGKIRNRRPNVGGRPSNAQRIDELNKQVARLRSLVSSRHHSDSTWHLVDQLLTTIGELDDLSTPLKSTTWDNTGTSAERPILPGVHVSDRGIVHGGTYADKLNVWLHLTVAWAVSSARARLVGNEANPKPRPPRKEHHATGDTQQTKPL